MSSRNQPTVAVVGVGSVGAMALWQLAKQGVSAVGYDSYAPGHDRGAAGGESRILRAAPRRGPQYVPLLRRARELWQELEDDSGHRLFHRTGCVTVGPAEHAGLRAVQDIAEAQDLPLEWLEAAEAARRVPEHPLRDGEAMVLDPEGGLLRPEVSVLAAASRAEALGAQIHRYTPVVDVEDDGDSATVVTEHGRQHYDRVILAPGPWLQGFPVIPSRDVTVSKVDVLWFARRTPGTFLPERTPVAMRVGDPAMSCCPGADGAKIVPREQDKAEIDYPETLPRDVPADQVARAREAVQQVMPGLFPSPIRTATYGEAYTADGHGMLGAPGMSEALVIAAAFSGHGFQLAPVLGEISADLALTGITDHNVAFLGPDRQQHG
ncbi:N-methyl-L-tryptophan oxidase [Saccharopolyspora sp. SCSIO 74807]|uniref:N-methyl-L-tryptophan oxidase n=1 Tax=Saccharopolyspora sp. SCSIO 74807 TaxID=3118084 RepID=UPI0030D379C3